MEVEAAHAQAEESVAEMLRAAALAEQDSPATPFDASIAMKANSRNAKKGVVQEGRVAKKEVANEGVAKEGVAKEGVARYRMDQRNHLGADMDASALYAERFTSAEHPSLKEVRERTAQQLPGRTHMLSGAVQGQLLGMLASLSGARDVLELGCFTAYSALSVASAMDADGIVYTVERDDDVAAMARSNIAMSPWAHKVHLVQGDAIDVLEALHTACQEEAPTQHALLPNLPRVLPRNGFDMVFLDANKKQYSNYFKMLFDLQLLRVGGILVVDNVLWKGKVPELYGLTVDERHERNQQLQRKGVMALVEADKYAEAMHAFNSAVRHDPRAQVVMLPQRDGLSIIRRIS
mmetsp:Transcript_38166/g.56057  ORF Transcript_38166/g.56057 Transcript_38166/m.56057 type:complete len:349 (+) Transcript_38166:3-1049(+)